MTSSWCVTSTATAERRTSSCTEIQAVSMTDSRKGSSLHLWTKIVTFSTSQTVHSSSRRQRSRPQESRSGRNSASRILSLLKRRSVGLTRANSLTITSTKSFCKRSAIGSATLSSIFVTLIRRRCVTFWKSLRSCCPRTRTARAQKLAMATVRATMRPNETPKPKERVKQARRKSWAKPRNLEPLSARTSNNLDSLINAHSINNLKQS